MTLRTIKILSSNEMMGDDPAVVDKLYLYENHFTRIGDLTPFSNLVSLWLNNNSIEKIEGLNNCRNLVCLYLNHNRINKIEGLEELDKLEILNL